MQAQAEEEDAAPRDEGEGCERSLNRRCEGAGMLRLGDDDRTHGMKKAQDNCPVAGGTCMAWLTAGRKCMSFLTWG